MGIMNNILLIEDDMSINKILAYELRKKGYLVDSLYDGKEAVSKILENDYDLVLIGCFHIKMVSLLLKK